MRALMVAMLTLWVATCGQKGPLELPEPRSAPATFAADPSALAERVDGS